MDFLKNNKYLALFNNWFVRIFAFGWVVFLILNYMINSPKLNNAIHYFQYKGLVVTLLLIFLGFVFLKLKQRKLAWELNFNGLRGWEVYSLMLVFAFSLFYSYWSNIHEFYQQFQNAKEFSTDPASATSNMLGYLGIRVILIHVLLLQAYVLGHLLLKKLFNWATDSKVVLIAFGFAVYGMLLFFAGALHMLTIPVLLVILGASLIFTYKEALSFLKSLFVNRGKDFSLHTAALLPILVLLVYVAANPIAALKLYPVGFDSLAMYINTPKLISEYNGLTQGGQAYNWQMIISLGFLFYENDASLALLLSILPGILSIIVLYQIARKFTNTSWSAVAAALFYTIPFILWQSTQEEKIDFGLLFILLSAVLFVLESPVFKPDSERVSGSISFLKKTFAVNGQWIMALLLGILLGYAIGIKYTAVIAFFGFSGWLAYKSLNKWIAAGLFFFFLSAVFMFDLYKFASVQVAADQQRILYMVPAIIGLLLTAFGILKLNDKKKLLPSAVMLMFFFAGTGLSYSPWLLKNYGETKELSVTALMNGKLPLEELKFENKDASLDPIGGRQWWEDFVESGDTIVEIDSANMAKASTMSDEEFMKEDTIINTSAYEEINRYIGYEPGLVRYISYFYDDTMKVNISLMSTDIGFFFLCCIPLLFFSFKPEGIFRNIGVAVMLLLFLAISIHSFQLNKMKRRANDFNMPELTSLDAKIGYENGDTTTLRQEIEKMHFGADTLMTNTLGKNLFKPAYIALSNLGFKTSGLHDKLSYTENGDFKNYLVIVLSLPFWIFLFYRVWKRKDENMNGLLVFGGIYFVFWLIMASGVVWYGIAGFALAVVVGVAYLLPPKNEDADPWLRRIVLGTISIAMVLALVSRLCVINVPGGREIDNQNARFIFESLFAQYITGEIDENKVLEKMNPAYPKALKAINSDRNAKIIRVGTYMNYFIKNNDKRVYVDNQLDLFHSIHASSFSRDEITDKLKNSGIKYLILDLNTPTIDVTPEKSLTAKYYEVGDWLNYNTRVKLIATDRLMEDPNGNNMYFQGQQVRASYGLAGVRVLSAGSLALFEIQ